MRIVSARITGFRNLADVDLDLAPGVNIVLGPNGQGKTNLLEALHFPALGRSHRGARHDDLVAFGSDALHVAVTVEEAPGRGHRFEYGIDRAGGRRYRVDGEVVALQSELVGRLAAVYFDPETVRLVREGPEQRRRFLDRGLSLIDPAYLASLTAYHRALRQKASILRDLKRRLVSTAEVGDEVRAWNTELAHHAAAVIRGRARYLADLDPAARAAHGRLTDPRAELSTEYRPQMEAARAAAAAARRTEESLERAADGGPGSVSGAPRPASSEGEVGDPPQISPERPLEGPEKDDLEQEIFREFDYIWPDEVRRGRPLSGPQRDDLEVRLDGQDLRRYGSQGETRTAAVALVLGQSEVVHRRRQVRPVLFLDDIFSELDRERARRLQDLAVADHQLLVATARAEDVAGWRPAHRKVWTVAAGVLTVGDDV
ncbi:MAG: DNA replication and repair protein RecF [Candidatus Krumholzibacteriia bacterium]